VYWKLAGMVETKSGVLNAVCCAIATLCILFYICSAAGYSNRSNDLDNVNWFYSSTFQTTNFGLQGFGVKNGGSQQTVKYKNSDECTLDFCDICARDGQAAAALTVLSLFLTIAIAALSGMTVHKYHPQFQLINIVFTVIAIFFSMVALGLMNGQCLDKVKNDIDSMDFEWGPGASLNLVCLLFLAIVAVLLLVSAGLSKTDNNAAGGAHSQASATTQTAAGGVPATTSGAKANATSTAQVVGKGGAQV
jgi:ABC-type Na+ efflux pump permease subunit